MYHQKKTFFCWHIIFIMFFPESLALAGEIPKRYPEAEIRPPEGHVIGNILFTPDGTHLVGVGKDRPTRKGIIDFWDIKTHQLVRSLNHPPGLATGAFTDDGKPCPAWMTAMVFTPNGQRFVTASSDAKLRIFAAPKWELENTFDHEPEKHWPSGLAMLADGKRFLSSSRTFKQVALRIWDLNKREATPLKGRKELVGSLAASKDGKRFAIAYMAPITEIWDAEKLEVVGRLQLQKVEGFRGNFDSVAFSPDGKWIATGSIGPLRVIIWNSTTFKKQQECIGLSDVPEAIAFTNDSKLLVSCMGAEMNIPAKVCTWEVESGKLVYAFSPWKHGCTQQALSADDRWLVTRGVDSTLRLWDFEKIRREIGK